LLNVVLGLWLGGAALGQPLNDATRHALEKLFRDLPKVQAGAMVADARSGETLFDLNGERPFKPASVQKLFTTAAALERFGIDFGLATWAYLRDGDLLIVGGGDPALGDERLAKRDDRPVDYVFDEWASALRSRGVAEIQRIILDDTIFDDEPRHPDWPRDQADRWYQAPVGGLNVNDNCLDVKLAVSGRSVNLTLQPEIPGSWIDNRIGVGKKHEPVARRQFDRDVFEIRGTVTRGGELDSIAVRRPTAFFGHALRAALEKRGIKVRGEIVRADKANAGIAGATPIGMHETPLVDLLWRCNTFSQNMFAECLMKALAAYDRGRARTGHPGTWAGGRQVLMETLTPLGVDFAGVTIRDGCGLSYQNRVPPRAIIQLLVAMHKHRDARVFEQSLARAGEDGSMKHRYNDPALVGRVVGKTGTLKETAALAGLLTRDDGRVLAFAILLDGTQEARPIVEALKLLVAP
jgi:D-alanyl-D-alanine carboxypeptidase/D-alanyl-D-alanine-endopeptidase (penicillin-binding protein 4)